MHFLSLIRIYRRRDPSVLQQGRLQMLRKVLARARDIDVSRRQLGYMCNNYCNLFSSKRNVVSVGDKSHLRDKSQNLGDKSRQPICIYSSGFIRLI